jgi:tetratricopeptide (TPR) repeat protein
MDRIVFFTLLICFFSPTYAAEKTDFERRIDSVERNLKFVEANQLNYKIEKDLLKEAYSNNYEKISLFITILLGFIAILGYLGIKDIGSVKDKYYNELAELKRIKATFDIKANEFDVEKKKIDNELKAIIRENQEQNQKFKFIELKEKMSSLHHKENLPLALEFAKAALEIDPTDLDCLFTKGQILTKTNQLEGALVCFKSILDADPKNKISIINYIECLYFLGQTSEADTLVIENESIFETEGRENIKILFEIISNYHNKDIDKLKAIAKGFVSFENMNHRFNLLEKWDWGDAIYFAHNQESGEHKLVLEHLIMYCNRKLTGKRLLEALSLTIPSDDQ